MRTLRDEWERRLRENPDKEYPVLSTDQIKRRNEREMKVEDMDTAFYRDYKDDWGKVKAIVKGDE